VASAFVWFISHFPMRFAVWPSRQVSRRNWWKFTSILSNISRSITRTKYRYRREDSWDSIPLEEKHTKEENIPAPKITFRRWTSAALQIRPFPLVKVLQSFDSRRQEISRRREGKLAESLAQVRAQSAQSAQRKFSERLKQMRNSAWDVNVKRSNVISTYS